MFEESLITIVIRGLLKVEECLTLTFVFRIAFTVFVISQPGGAAAALH